MVFYFNDRPILIRNYQLIFIRYDSVGASAESEVSDELLTNHEELPAEEPALAVEPSEPEIEIAGVINWNRPSGVAFGAATSLYERHPVSGETAGNPLADVSQITNLNELSPTHRFLFFLAGLGICYRDTLQQRFIGSG